MSDEPELELDETADDMTDDEPVEEPVVEEDPTPGPFRATLFTGDVIDLTDVRHVGQASRADGVYQVWEVRLPVPSAEVETLHNQNLTKFCIVNYVYQPSE